MSNIHQVPGYTKTVFFRRKHTYCLVVPVINEGQRFLKQLERLQPYSDMVDIIIADGGSTDNSVDEQILKKYHVRALLIKTDPGKLSAQLRIAYSFALNEGYEGIITIDGNGKDGVEAISSFVKKLQEGYDYIQGSRFLPGGKAVNTPFLRHMANRYIHAPLLSIAANHFWFTDTTNGFRAYSKRYLEEKRVQPFRDIFIRYELLAYLTVRASQIGLQVIEIPVSRSYPKGTVPTKISAFQGNMDLLMTLFKTCIGRFNPDVS